MNLWKKISAAIAAIVASVSLWFSPGVFAVDNNISATPPTSNTDGSALIDLAAIRFYKSVVTTSSPDCAAATTVYALAKTVTITDVGLKANWLDANQTVNGRYCYKATAVRANGNESAFSNPAFKDVDLLLPKAPTLTVN